MTGYAENYAISYMSKLEEEDIFAIAPEPRQMFKWCKFQAAPETRACRNLTSGIDRLLCCS